ncbi:MULTISPECIES: SMI1/KNR4 family protein [Ruminococcus]|uniref:Cell wall assembly/cell proliferation coordinating protein, KNR4-like protein n=1 Tax=Ruminococcus albus (strain ATCC 27210 / DSM 20455 / JCM 14654 / NCDO 2250 / 7) TaxID=697329 RepID=E6UEI1_RUMA7|nr:MULTISPECIES: SMI1/KNR4 family protein [Ruminococcus]ADU20936.1 Cell wall assembly/cell proliferation coordinating protein, KNR4-like protein [Ruminococcus albus 7 = DSM 20455]MCR5021625.1 SMI1/KNR4 family protein [Ruminococcus sp.]
MEIFDRFEFAEPYRGEPIEDVGGVLLPEDYLAFMHEHDGGEGEVCGTYLVLFPLEDLKMVTDNYDAAELLPGCVIIGGDGGGELYGVDENGRYFNVPAMIDRKDITYLGDSFEAFIKNAAAMWEGDG